ncbi:MAG: indolepyruvate oxidoreductase subunit beta family protein [Hyphomicrobiaceae bacterium]
MDGTEKIDTSVRADRQTDSVIKLAILAVGGQGGGVLTDWIVALAERCDFFVQATSVAGVAQRTGATIYYVEMLPKPADAAPARRPVFALAPSAGDVDIVIAAELMEAGRAIQRGFVTPDRTTLIASSHRALATAEKIVPGDAIANSDAVHEASRQAAKNFLAFDMEKIAVESGTVVSASLFGALAGAGVLPFSVTDYETTITESGRGVEASLRAFRAARTLAESGHDARVPVREPLRSKHPHGPQHLLETWQKLQRRVADLPKPAQDIAHHGLVKVVDFQDPDYGAEYLDRLEHVAKLDRTQSGEAKDFALTATAAKYIANAMAYDDILRVADIKTRRDRFERVRHEAGGDDATVVKVTEYLHPGGREICSIMPARIGAWIERRPRTFRAVDWVVNRGQRVRTDGLFGFSLLFLIGGLRRWRRSLLRHKIEKAHINAWLETVHGHVPDNYDLAVALLRCRRLIKGYSDTHTRGLSKFDKVMEAAPLLEHRDDGAEWIDRLIAAALADEGGEALDGALATIGSFTNTDRQAALS